MDREKAIKAIREAPTEHDRGMLKLLLFPWLYGKDKMTKVTVDNTKCTCPIEPRHAMNHGHLEGCPAVIKKETTTESILGNERFKRAQKEMLEQDPPINVGDYWIVYNGTGEELRRLRIVGKHPWREGYIYEECPAKMKTGRMAGELSLCPEFNLRYVFRPEIKTE